MMKHDEFYGRIRNKITNLQQTKTLGIRPILRKVEDSKEAAPTKISIYPWPWINHKCRNLVGIPEPKDEEITVWLGLGFTS